MVLAGSKTSWVPQNLGQKEGRFVGNDKVDFIGDGVYLFLRSMEESGMSLEIGFSKVPHMFGVEPSLPVCWEAMQETLTRLTRASLVAKTQNGCSHLKLNPQINEYHSTLVLWKL